MKFVISLTTVPHRLEASNRGEKFGARPALMSLLEQEYDDFEVHFNIPNVYRAMSQVINLPEWLTDIEKTNSKLKIFRTEDYGSATKLYPTVKRVNDPETNIIIADDDLIYCQGILSVYKTAREKYPNDALGFAGISEIEGKWRHFCTTVDSDARVKIIEGYKTVCFKRSFFDDDYDKFVNVTWADDICMSAYLGYKNIKKLVLNYPHDTDFSPRVESFPVICHTAYDNQQGCNVFRRLVENCKEECEKVETIHKSWYQLGYLER